MDHQPYYKDIPASPTAILMIHGILGTPRHFDRLVEEIPDGITVHNILLAGHGGSVADFSRATMSQWREQVEDAIKALEQPGRRIVIVGHSLGALLAMHAQLQHESISGLLLLNPPLIPQFRLRLVGRSLRSAFGKLRYDDPAEVMYSKASGIATEPDLWKYFGWIPNFLALLRLCRKTRAIPAKLTVPCVVYLGEDDDLVHIRSRKWLEGLEHIKINILPNGSHFGYNQEEQQDITNSLLEML